MQLPPKGCAHRVDNHGILQSKYEALDCSSCHFSLARDSGRYFLHSVWPSRIAWETQSTQPTASSERLALNQNYWYLVYIPWVYDRKYFSSNTTQKGPLCLVLLKCQLIFKDLRFVLRQYDMVGSVIRCSAYRCGVAVLSSILQHLNSLSVEGACDELCLQSLSDLRFARNVSGSARHYPSDSCYRILYTIMKFHRPHVCTNKLPILDLVIPSHFQARPWHPTFYTSLMLGNINYARHMG